MTRDQRQNLISDAHEALRTVAEKHGVKFEPTGSLSYWDEGFKFGGQFAEEGKDGPTMTMEAKSWSFYAEAYGLKVDLLGKTVQTDRDRYVVLGLNPKAPKNPVIVQRVRDGRRFKMSTAGLRMANVVAN